MRADFNKRKTQTLRVTVQCWQLLQLTNTNLTFTGPCIVTDSYNKSQRDALFLKFILVNNSTCFGQIYC